MADQALPRGAGACVMILSLAVLIGGIVLSILLGCDGHERTCPVTPCLTKSVRRGGAPGRNENRTQRKRRWSGSA